MNCLSCSRLDLQTHKKHAAIGAGRCPLQVAGTFVSVLFQRECTSFKPAAPEIVAAREAWAKKL